MKAKIAVIDPKACIACGMCINTCPDVFDWGQDGLARVSNADATENFMDEVEEAVEDCPTEAIKVVEK